MRERSKGHWRGILGMDLKYTIVTLHSRADSIPLSNTHLPLIFTLLKKGRVTVKQSLKLAIYELPNLEGAPKDQVHYPPLQSFSLHLSNSCGNPLYDRCTFRSLLHPGAARFPAWFHTGEGELPFTLSFSVLVDLPSPECSKQ